MPSSRQPSRFPQTLALIAAMGIVLSGCGIKSALETPRAANQPETPAPAASAAAQEKSAVQSGRSFTLLPPDQPYEWEQERKEQRNKRSPSKTGSKSTVPDKPFILDSLL